MHNEWHSWLLKTGNGSKSEVKFDFNSCIKSIFMITWFHYLILHGLIWKEPQLSRVQMWVWPYHSAALSLQKCQKAPISTWPDTCMHSGSDLFHTGILDSVNLKPETHLRSIDCYQLVWSSYYDMGPVLHVSYVKYMCNITYIFPYTNCTLQNV